MSSDETESSNPGRKNVSAVLCAAYRDALKAEIKGLRNTIVVSLSIATTIIVIVQYALAMMPK